MSPTESAGQPLVIVLLGPTASGKTDLAIALAQALDLAVLNVDSRQLYRQMDVGTAKPTAAQRDQARHELLDLRDPDQPINLQEFRAIAEAQLNAELAQRRAAAARDYLVSKGIEKNRVYTEGKGEKQPVADNKTAEGRAQNRRVVLVVLK